MRALVVLFALTVLSCGRSPPKWWGIDYRFTDAETAEITSAMVMWNAVTLDEYTMLPALDADLVDAFIVREAPVVGYNGLWSSGEQLLRIAPDLPRGMVARVARHELGHALGLNHTTHGVMQDPDAMLEPTDEDMAACRFAGVCR